MAYVVREQQAEQAPSKYTVRQPEQTGTNVFAEAARRTIGIGNQEMAEEYKAAPKIAGALAVGVPIWGASKLAGLSELAFGKSAEAAYKAEEQVGELTPQWLRVKTKAGERGVESVSKVIDTMLIPAHFIQKKTGEYVGPRAAYVVGLAAELLSFKYAHAGVKKAATKIKTISNKKILSDKIKKLTPEEREQLGEVVKTNESVLKDEFNKEFGDETPVKPVKAKTEAEATPETNVPTGKLKRVLEGKEEMPVPEKKGQRVETEYTEASPPPIAPSAVARPAPEPAPVKPAPIVKKFKATKIKPKKKTTKKEQVIKEEDVKFKQKDLTKPAIRTKDGTIYTGPEFSESWSVANPKVAVKEGPKSFSKAREAARSDGKTLVSKNGSELYQKGFMIKDQFISTDTISKSTALESKGVKLRERVAVKKAERIVKQGEAELKKLHDSKVRVEKQKEKIKKLGEPTKEHEQVFNKLVPVTKQGKEISHNNLAIKAVRSYKNLFPVLSELFPHNRLNNVARSAIWEYVRRINPADLEGFLRGKEQHKIKGSAYKVGKNAVQNYVKEQLGSKQGKSRRAVTRELIDRTFRDAKVYEEGKRSSIAEKAEALDALGKELGEEAGATVSKTKIEKLTTTKSVEARVKATASKPKTISKEQYLKDKAREQKQAEQSAKDIAKKGKEKFKEHRATKLSKKDKLTRDERMQAQEIINKATATVTEKQGVSTRDIREVLKGDRFDDLRLYRGQRDVPELETYDVGIHTTIDPKLAKKYFANEPGQKVKKLKAKTKLRTAILEDAGVGWDNPLTLLSKIKDTIKSLGDRENNARLAGLKKAINKNFDKEKARLIENDRGLGKLEDYYAEVAIKSYKDAKIDAIVYENAFENMKGTPSKNNVSVLILNKKNLRPRKTTPTKVIDKIKEESGEAPIISDAARIIYKLPGKVEKLWTKHVGDPVWDTFVLKKLPKILDKDPYIGRRINRFFLREYRRGLKNTEKFIKSHDDMIRKQQLGSEYALDLGGRLQDMSNKSQLKVARVIKGDEGVKLSKRENSLAKETIQVFYNLGKQAVDLGILDGEKFFSNVGRYMPRLYDKLEFQTNLRKYKLAAPDKLDLTRFKDRKSIDKKTREEMGEIMTPGYPVAKGISQITHDIQMAKFFRGIVRNEDWSLPKGSKTVAPKDWKTLPINKKFGDLSGAKVHPEIFKDITHSIRELKNWEKTWRKALGYWKTGKVVLSTSAQARNMMSNSTLAHLGGLPMHSQPKYLAAAAKVLNNKKGYYEEVLPTGMLQNTFINAELKGLFGDAHSKLRGSYLENLPGIYGKVGGALQKVKTTAGKGVEKASDAYQWNEHVFKMAKYIYNREVNKMSIKDSAADATKWLFDYGKVTKAQEAFRTNPLGAPFATFTLKAAPRIVEAAVKTPWRFFEPYMLNKSLQFAAQSLIGDTKEQAEAKKQLRPSWMKTMMSFAGIELYPRIPFVDKIGREHYLNLTYIAPWGDIADSGSFFLPGSLRPLSMPFISELVQQSFNKDLFWEQPIVSSEDTAGKGWVGTAKEHIKKRGAHALKHLEPGFVSTGRQIHDATVGKLDSKGRTKPLWIALAGGVGLKIYPVDYAEQLVRKISKSHPKKSMDARKLRYRIKTSAVKMDVDEKKGKDVTKYQKEIKGYIKQLMGMAKEVDKVGEQFDKTQ